jgi:hypothetical protein
MSQSHNQLGLQMKFSDEIRKLSLSLEIKKKSMLVQMSFRSI